MPGEEKTNPKEKFHNGVTKTQNLVKEYSPEKFQSEERKKEVGVASGEFLSSASKRSSAIRKLWLNKKTATESILARINSTNKPAYSDFFRIIYFCELHKVPKQLIDKVVKDIDEHYTKHPFLITNNECFKKIVAETALKEKIAEVLGGELNRLIDGEKADPKTRILHKAEDDSFSVMSKILPKSKDLFDAYQDLGQRPVKKLYAAIIIRLFLGDNPADIKLENMLLYKSVDKNGAKCFKVCNIDFGSCFTKDHNNFLANNFKSSDFFDKIGEFGLKGNESLKGNMSELLGRHLSQREINDEIQDTFKKIADLRDEDLQCIVDKLSQIKDKEGAELVSPEMRAQYLEKIKNNRTHFCDVYHKIAEARRPAPIVVPTDVSELLFQRIDDAARVRR